MSAVADDLVKCKHCAGSGHVPLQRLRPELVRTLEVLREHGPQSAKSLFASGLVGDYTSATAINNQLEALRQFGLVTRERRGIRFFYSAIEKSGG